MPLEPAGPDFPFYRADGTPKLSGTGWLVVLAGVVAGFAALATPLPFGNALTAWLRTGAFVGLPLLGLAVAAPGGWRALFGPIGRREWRLMLAFALLCLTVSLAAGVVVQAISPATANSAIAGAGQLEGLRLANFFAIVALQLLGEELITILPFLAIMAGCHASGRGRPVATAWLGSAIAFALLHLPTYHWNLVQCLVAIGGARLILTWAYVWTKNIWVSTGAHILNDWAILAATIFLFQPAGGA